MAPTNDPLGQPDPFNLRRFVSAQEEIYSRRAETVYAAALAELRSGQKRTHWMWFIFPQYKGLGYSSMSQHYAIQSSEEARHYLSHPLLGSRLVECAEAVLNTNGRSASQIFGSPDDMKLRSSMTLFATVTDSESIFSRVLDKYFQGQQDTKTLELLTKDSSNDNMA